MAGVYSYPQPNGRTFVLYIEEGPPVRRRFELIDEHGIVKSHREIDAARLDDYDSAGVIAASSGMNFGAAYLQLRSSKGLEP